MINSGTGVQTRATGALIPTSMAVQKRSITTSHPLDFTLRETLRSLQLSGLSLNGKDYEFNAAARDLCCSPYLVWSWLRIRKPQTSGLAHCGCVGSRRISGHAARINAFRWRHYRRFVVRHACCRLWSYEEAWGEVWDWRDKTNECCVEATIRLLPTVPDTWWKIERARRWEQFRTYIDRSEIRYDFWDTSN